MNFLIFQVYIFSSLCTVQFKIFPIIHFIHHFFSWSEGANMHIQYDGWDCPIPKGAISIQHALFSHFFATLRVFQQRQECAVNWVIGLSSINTYIQQKIKSCSVQVFVFCSTDLYFGDGQHYAAILCWGIRNTICSCPPPIVVFLSYLSLNHLPCSKYYFKNS